MSRGRRAFTLVETVLAAVLLSLLVTLFVQVLVPLTRAAGRGADKVELRQMVVACLDKLAADLNRSTSLGISQRANPLVVSIQPLAGVTADAHQAWAEQLIIYGCAGPRLVRRTWPPGPPDLGWVPAAAAARGVGAAELTRFLTEPNGSQTVLANWVKSCSVVKDGSAVTLELTVERDGAGPQGKEAYRAAFTQYLRNP